MPERPGAERPSPHSGRRRALVAGEALRRAARAWSALALGTTLLLGAAPVAAELDLPEVVARLPAEQRTSLSNLWRQRASERISLLVERLESGAAWPPGATPLGRGFSALEVAPAALSRLFAEHPSFRFTWSPGQRLLLDRADGWVRASSVRNATGASGAGVIVGIVDSGVDVRHPDLRHADGTTRVRWFVDFGRPALGRHAELEAALGCAGPSECAIYAAAEIDELVANDVPRDEPDDTVGHGTMVASLAAGNGASHDPPRYVGVAPEAELVVVRVTTTGLDIPDADIVRAVRFVFERAAELGRPAVVNLSLGSDFGPHDGSSSLARALAELVGPEHPGRAIVTAAGNSAELYLDPANERRALGIHTELHLPRASALDVPLITLTSFEGEAGLDVWLEARPGDAVSVGLAQGERTLIAPVAPGESAAFDEPGLRAVIHNVPSARPSRELPSAVVQIRAAAAPNDGYRLRLEGRGSVAFWLQGHGVLDPRRGLALVSGALRSGTINAIAAHPELIAVGATLNRTSWPDYRGEVSEAAEHGPLLDAPEDTTAVFSAAGPSSLGMLKPDLVAPGAQVIGAMASSANPFGTTPPRTDGMFGACGTGEPCLVADAWHGVSSGTSLAAPVVTGAVALLLEQDPGLTQDELQGLLRAGARPLEGAVFSEQQVGSGALDLEATFAAHAERRAPARRTPSARSRLLAAAEHARPDPGWPLVFQLALRDADGRLADGFDPARLTLAVRGAAVIEPLGWVAPGLYRFSVAAPPESGGTSLRVAARFDGRELAVREIPIEVDPLVREHGVTARGGCGVSVGRAPALELAIAAALGLGLSSCRRRRRTRAAGVV